MTGKQQKVNLQKIKGKLEAGKIVRKASESREKI
jgi:hypothetical protein